MGGFASAGSNPALPNHPYSCTKLVAIMVAMLRGWDGGWDYDVIQRRAAECEAGPALHRVIPQQNIIIIVRRSYGRVLHMACMRAFLMVLTC